MSASDWSPIAVDPPAGTPVLIWIEQSCSVALLVEGSDAKGSWRVFMDPRSDEALPWPTHWMPLPQPPL